MPGMRTHRAALMAGKKMAGKKESKTVGTFVGTQRLEGLLALATRFRAS